jgi:hypothetical protein
MYEWWVNIPTIEGPARLDIAGRDLDDQREKHGVNVNNVNLLVLCWCSLLSDSPVDSPKPHRVLRDFKKRLSGDLSGTIRRFSSLAHALTLSLSTDQDGVIIEPFLKGMQKTPVFREYLLFFRTKDPCLLTFLLSFLSFGKKLFYDDSSLDETAFRGWVEVEDRLTNLILPAWVDNLKVIVEMICKDFNPDYFLPSHGGGRVSERGVSGTEMKNQSFGLSPGLSYLFRDNSIFLRNETEVETIPGSAEGRQPSIAYSRLKFVPKDWKTSRSICMEPIAYQWAQQGVRLWVERMISEGILKRHIVLKDQGVNQFYSRVGSMTRLLDTIDLSSASDSVSWDLVSKIFPAKVLKYLAGTRTRMVEAPNGDFISIKKFAPMGSALCFPVQSIIYSAVCIYAGICAVHGYSWEEIIPDFAGNVEALYTWTFGVGPYDRSPLLPFVCYGDDIIVDTATTSIVIRALQSLGFVVNEDKSFVGQSSFRESCGEHYFDGASVTPFYFKVKRIGDRLSIESLAGVIEHANKAGFYGYTNLRKCLIQFALRYPIIGVKEKPGGNPILFSEDPDDSFSILCDNPRNTHLRKRCYDPECPRQDTSSFYQRDEVESIAMRPLRGLEQSKRFDNYRLLKWWRSRYSDPGTDPMGSGAGTADVRGIALEWRWTRHS